MTTNLPDYYLHSAQADIRIEPKFPVLDLFKFNENFIIRSRQNIRPPNANIAYLQLEREYRKHNFSDVRDVANGAWRIELEIEHGPQPERIEDRTTHIRRAINRRLTLLEDSEYIQIYGT